MDFEADRDTSPKGDPSLAEMTRAALKILQKNTKGFFLFVEGKFSIIHKLIFATLNNTANFKFYNSINYWQKYSFCLNRICKICLLILTIFLQL